MHILVYGMVGNHRGGIETFLLKMNGFMSSDIIFDYVIEEKECLHEEEIKRRGGCIYRVPSRNRNPLGNIRDNKKILSGLRSEVEAVYFNLSSLSWIEPIRIAKKLGYRVYVHSHNAQFIKNNSSIAYRIINAINKRRLGMYKNITRLTCSRPATNFMFMKKDKVEMIYNAVNVKEFLFDEEIRKEKRRELEVDESELLVGFVGRIQDQKNPLYLPKIMRAAINQCPKKGIKMIIVGDGDMKGDLKKEVDELKLSSVVSFLGNRTDVNKLMQAMDILVLPSHHEGLPFVVIEAQASGLTCLVSEKVTTEVDYTGNVVFLDLNDRAENWGKEIFNTKLGTDRKQISHKAEQSNFNIVNEAKRLERILLS